MKMTCLRPFACAAGLLLTLGSPGTRLAVLGIPSPSEAYAGPIGELSYSQKKRARKMRELAHARSQWAMQVEEAQIRAIQLRLGHWWWYVLALREQRPDRVNVRYVKLQHSRAAAETIYLFMKNRYGNARRDFVFYGFLLEADADACYQRQLWAAKMAGATIESESTYSPGEIPP